MRTSRLGGPHRFINEELTQKRCADEGKAKNINTYIIKAIVYQMMDRLRLYDVFRFAQNDVARFTRNDAMFAPMCRQAHIIRVANIIGKANIICPQGKFR